MKHWQPMTQDELKKYVPDIEGELERLQEQLKEVQQELQIRINDNADMYSKLCNALMQLEEANNIIKKYVETIPKVPNDGCHIPNYNFDNAECYLKKWGIK